MDYKKELQKIEDNKDEFLRRYGKKQYQKAVNYYTRKVNYSPFEQADISPSMREYDSLISNPQKQSEFLKKYGPEQYEIALDYYSQKADEEINSAYTAYQTAVQQTKLSTLQKYGLDARYSDSYEDKIRKLAGAVPISFDISKYIPTTEGMTWDDQSVDLALSAWKKQQDAIASQQNMIADLQQQKTNEVLAPFEFGQASAQARREADEKKQRENRELINSPEYKTAIDKAKQSSEREFSFSVVNKNAPKNLVYYINNLDWENTGLVDKNGKRRTDIQGTYGDAGLAFANISPEYNYLTKDERDMLLYYYGKGDLEAFKKYQSELEPELRKRQYGEEQAFTQAFADEEGPTGEIYAALQSVGRSYAAPIAFGETVAAGITGNEVDTSSRFQQAARSAGKYQGIATENTKGFGKFVADSAISLAQNIPSFALAGAGLPGIGAAYSASSVAGSASAEKNAQGFTPLESAGYGTLMGAIEYFAEKIPLGRLDKLAQSGAKGVLDVAKNAFAQAGVEFTQETATSIISNLADLTVAGEASKFSQLLNQNIQSGMTEEEAQAAALTELLILNPLYEGAIGAATGGITGGIASASNIRIGQETQTGTPYISLDELGDIITQNGEIAIPELPELNSIAPVEQKQAEVPATPEIGAQGATAPIINAQTKVHESAESLLETYAGTEYGDLLASEIERGSASYTQESAVNDLNKAIQDVKSGKLTVDNYTSVTQENGELSKYNKTDVTRLMALIDDAVQRGDTVAYDELNAAIFDVGLQLGRGVQAFALLKKSSPAMHLASIEREIARFNIDGQKRFKDKWNDVSLTQEEKQAILNGQTIEERTAAYQQAIQRIQSNLPSTTWDKLDQLRKTSMLFNPRTQIRNIAGNAMYTVMNAIRRKVEAGIQQFAPKDQRTESFIIKPEYRENAKGDFENVKDAYKNYGRFNMDAKLGQGYTQAFKNKGIGKAINKVSELTGMALDIGDVVFGKHHYETTLASYMQAKGLKEITGEARAYAMERALEATFRAESKAADAINGLIKKGGIMGKAASVVMPFVKTPINIAKESFDYSPLGMGKSLLVDTIRVKKGDMSATQYIHNLAKGLTGTAVSTLGFLLAMGALIPGVELTGAPPEDKKEREFLYAQGWKPYSLKIGDAYFPVSWAQPVATTMLMGVTVADTIGRDEDFQLVDATGLIGTFFDSIAEISPLAGLKDLFMFNDTIGDAVVNLGQDLTSQFIPAIGRQISRVADPNEYDIYTGDPANQLKNQAATTFGFANEADVAQKVDVWGQPQTQEGGWLERLLQNMVSPTNISVASEDAINNELMRLYKATGDADALPIVFNERELATNDVKEIFGDSINLSAKELQELKEGIGQSSRIAVEDYINSEQYKADDDTTRVKKINTMYDDVRELYRQAKARGLDLPSITDQVDVQSQEYFLGEADNPIPDVAMLMPEYDYGVKNDVSDILFALYKDTGDNSFLLEPEDNFKYKGKTYEYDGDPRVEVFEGYGELPGLNDVVGSAWFESQSDDQKAKIVDNTVDDILEALEYDVVSNEDPLAILAQAEKTDTTAYERFNAPGWKNYGPDDKIVKQLDSLGVYPKVKDEFTDNKITYTLTEADKKTLADMTYKELLKLGTLDADSAQKAIDKAYTVFKNMVIEREK